jgi:polysaccharide biosynthesis transport protein
VNRLRPDDSRLNPNFSQQGSTPSADEPGIDVRRYLGALRRSRGLIIAIVVVMTGGILALSLALPNKYDATATVVLDAETSALTSPDAVSTQRRLTTLNLLLTSGDVIDKADEQLAEQHPGASSPSITSTVDPNANILRITATGQDAEVAAAYANDVARSFLDVQAKLERNRYEAASADVRAQLATLDDTTDAADLASALRDRLSELAVQAASAGSDLQLAETASVPSSPASPRPLRNTVLALFTALFIAVLVALGRDLLRPRVSDPRELSQLLGIPVLAAIPHLRRRLGRRRRIGRAIEYEAYETLRSAIQIGSSSRSPQVIMVTSALHAEGKTTVTARLGRALARSGKRTLLVSADLRWPALHREFDLEVEPGLSDVLKLAERAGISDHLLPAAIHQIGGDGGNGSQPSLDVLTSGQKPPDPGRLLASPATHAFFEYLRGFDYDYVLVDAPPMLGIGDTQVLSRESDAVLLVAALERLTADHVIDMSDLIDRLRMRMLGLVVIGARVDVSPYYLGGRAGAFQQESVTEQEAWRPAG